MKTCRRRSDILVNTFHMDAIPSMPYEKRVNISPERHSIIISDETYDKEELVRSEMESLGVDPDTTVYFYNPDLVESVTEHTRLVLQKIISLGYDLGFHFDNNEERVSSIIEYIQDVRIVSIK